MTVIATSDVTLVDVSTLTPHPANPRRGNVKAIAESIQRNGWHGVVVVQQEMHDGDDGKHRILVGAHRVQAAISIGMKEVPVQFRDVDDLDALRIVLADNRASDLATYDNDRLLENLKHIGDPQGTLFDLDAIETLTANAGQAEVAPEAPFGGGFADAGAEMEQRKVAAERIAQEMKDVVLVMKPEDYAQYQADIKVLQKRWNLNGVIVTTITAVHKAALEEGDLGQSDVRVEKMRAWAQKLLWAVPNDERVAFGEDFGV
jgi:hypothetical protein